MAGARKPWVRGAVVLGLAGAMMAVALMSPALAVRLATTSYVKAKINQSEAAAAARFLDVGEGDGRYIEDGVFTLERGPLTLLDGQEGFVEAICPPGTVAVGGGGWTSNTGMLLEASYPSNGTGTDTTGTTAWTSWAVNASGITGQLFGYVICARSGAQLARATTARSDRGPAAASSRFAGN